MYVHSYMYCDCSYIVTDSHYLWIVSVQEVLGLGMCGGRIINVGFDCIPAVYTKFLWAGNLLAIYIGTS